MSDQAWVLIYPELLTVPHVKIGNLDQCRTFMSAVLWLLREGLEGRMLPPELGQWNSVFKRYSRECALGAWDLLLNKFSQPDDLQDALGCSKGGFSCKVAVCDAQGLPLHFILTGGQTADCTPAIPLLTNINAETVLANKAYDTNELRDGLKERKKKYPRSKNVVLIAPYKGVHDSVGNPILQFHPFIFVTSKTTASVNTLDIY